MRCCFAITLFYTIKIKKVKLNVLSETRGETIMTVDPELKNLDMLDALSERHGALRNIVENKANDKNGIHNSSSEWYIMAKLYVSKLTFVEVTQSVNLTRQAIHKAIKQLEEKELVKVENLVHNKKEKCVSLTDRGIECIEQYMTYKQSIEKHLAQVIGTEQLQLFKTILHQDWQLEDLQ